MVKWFSFDVPFMCLVMQSVHLDKQVSLVVLAGPKTELVFEKKNSVLSSEVLSSDVQCGEP